MASFQLEKPLCINAKSFNIGQCDSVSVKTNSSRQSHASACAKNLLTVYVLLQLEIGVNKNY